MERFLFGNVAWLFGLPSKLSLPLGNGLPFLEAVHISSLWVFHQVELARMIRCIVVWFPNIVDSVVPGHDLPRIDFEFHGGFNQGWVVFDLLLELIVDEMRLYEEASVVEP